MAHLWTSDDYDNGGVWMCFDQLIDDWTVGKLIAFDFDCCEHVLSLSYATFIFLTVYWLSEDGF